MLLLTIRTEKPDAEIGLYVDGQPLASLSWEAHRQLAETIHIKIKQLLDQQESTWHDLAGLVVYKGPGSFTGLRIGFSVANALADSLAIPIVAETGDAWIINGCRRLTNGENEQLALPEYGSPPHITKPKH